MGDTGMEAARAATDRTAEPDHVEEFLHSLTHCLGALGALAALPWLMSAAGQRGDVIDLAAALVFGLAALCVYAASTLYHALPPGRAKEVMQVVDHGAIFLLIAGTYTPFTVGALRGAWGWTVFGLIWALAAAGLALKWRVGIGYPRLSTGLYLAMGWVGLLAIQPQIERIPDGGLLWLGLGGAAYTAGVPFFIADSRRFNHAVWHLFVLAGTGCHLMAVMGHAASGA